MPPLAGLDRWGFLMAINIPSLTGLEKMDAMTDFTELHPD